MDCCYPDECGEYAVTPILTEPCIPAKCCEDTMVCFPCLPRCHKSPVVYCCEKKSPRAPQRSPVRYDRDEYADGYNKMESYDHSPSRHRYPRSPPPSPTRQEPCRPPPNYCSSCCHPTCKPVKTKYVVPCYRYEDGRIVRKLPVTAFKRNGMQDQEHSKMQGTTNFLFRSPRDVSIECDVCIDSVKVGDPAKVPPCTNKPVLGCSFLRKKPIEVSLEDILDD